MRQLVGNRFSWLIRRWLGKLPALARTGPFVEFS